MVKEKKKKIRSGSHQVQESIIEELILGIKRTKLFDLVKVGIVFNQGTLDKSRKEEYWNWRNELNWKNIIEWILIR